MKSSTKKLPIDDGYIQELIARLEALDVDALEEYQSVQRWLSEVHQHNAKEEIHRFICPYCGSDLDQDIPLCCGEFGHGIWEEEWEE